jgi:diaminopimelate decarboxylase
MNSACAVHPYNYNAVQILNNGGKMLNDSIRYVNHKLMIDDVDLADLARETGTPAYVYSLPRALQNYRRIANAFADFDAHIHYSAKANANLAVFGALIQAGAGIDAVSAGEAYRALRAGCAPENIVFAGVGKRYDELRWAVEQNIGWFNVENVRELELLNALGSQFGKRPRVALRLNPDVTANTHPYIATGHGGAKFGLTRDVVADMFSRQKDYPQVDFAGIHLHIGSQLGDTEATQTAVQAALDLISPYAGIRTVNVGGGLPVAYQPGQMLPSPADFATMIRPLLKDYTIILEPGRSVIADAGLLVVEVLYVKQQAGQRIVIVDGSMTELLRPALYQANHMIVPLKEASGDYSPAEIVGPVCESADTLGHAVPLPDVEPGDRLAILTAGAYGMVMSSNYNARPRPPEIVIEPDGTSWGIARRRETWDDLIRLES